MQPLAPQDIAAEIDMLRGDFVTLGVNPDTAVPLWLGKVSRHTGQTLQTPMQVLTHLQTEMQQASTVQLTQLPAEATVRFGTSAQPTLTQAPAQPVVSPQAVLKQQYEAANNAWRKAVNDRRNAFRSWDDYVAALREEARAAKARAGLR